MNLKKNAIYYFLALLIFVVFKLLYRDATTQDLVFLLNPVRWLVDIATYTQSTFITDKGYFNDALNIVIDKSCSGFNFFVLCFLMLTFLTVGNLKNRNSKWLSLVVLFILAYLITIVTNASRILTSLFLHKVFRTYAIPRLEVWHKVEGAFVYLFCLVAVYLLTEFLLKRYINHSKH